MEKQTLRIERGDERLGKRPQARGGDLGRLAYRGGKAASTEDFVAMRKA